MKDAKHTALPAVGTVGESISEARADELRVLYAEIAELRAKGIISGGKGPRGSLRPVAQLPGALARFLDERG